MRFVPSSQEAAQHALMARAGPRASVHGEQAWGRLPSPLLQGPGTLAPAALLALVGAAVFTLLLLLGAPVAPCPVWQPPRAEPLRRLGALGPRPLRPRPLSAPSGWPCWAGLFPPQVPESVSPCGCSVLGPGHAGCGGQGSSAVGRVSWRRPPPQASAPALGFTSAECALLVQRAFPIKRELFLFSSFAVLRSSLFRTSLGHCRASGESGRPPMTTSVCEKPGLAAACPALRERARGPPWPALRSTPRLDQPNSPGMWTAAPSLQTHASQARSVAVAICRCGFWLPVLAVSMCSSRSCLHSSQETVDYNSLEQESETCPEPPPRLSAQSCHRCPPHPLRSATACLGGGPPPAAGPASSLAPAQLGVSGSLGRPRPREHRVQQPPGPSWLPRAAWPSP